MIIQHFNKDSFKTDAEEFEIVFFMKHSFIFYLAFMGGFSAVIRLKF
jgi:hypothetical protein